MKHIKIYLKDLENRILIDLINTDTCEEEEQDLIQRKLIDQ